ncbi:hypothetical protein EV12_2430 [Prochlorococcus sp. MIT 0701]|nr:hypothetical protein EV12_2430 [Prochlorococcus sp. MIT 0701]
MIRKGWSGQACSSSSCGMTPPLNESWIESRRLLLLKTCGAMS